MVISGPVLLDVVTPDLESVNITSGGKLVFDPNVDLAKLAAEWIQVSGELWIGSESCPFSGNAEIELVGLKGETAGWSVDGGTPILKAIVVDAGRLEVHGAPQPAWARLQTTLPKTTRDLVVGSPIFDYTASSQSNNGHGFTAYLLWPNGTAIEYLGQLHRTCEFAELITHQDKVVLIVVQRNVDLEDDQTPENVAEAFEQVCYGGTRQSHLRSVTNDQTVAWAAICHVGHPENSVEELGHPEADKSKTSRLQKRIGDVDFVVQSITQLDSNWPFAVDMLSYSAGGVPSDTTVLDMDRDVSSWNVGNTIAITSTDYDWRQAEELTLLECLDCAATQIKVGQPVQYTHWGETTDGVNQAAEAGLLNRNVRIHGRMEEHCYGDNKCEMYDFDTFGGQIRILSAFETVHIANAEIANMGQNSVIGSYPIHFHMCGDVDNKAEPPYIKSNSIHHTYARCVTVHGTRGVLLEDNMAYDHHGHCFFLEDGDEARTVFRRNLGFSTRNTNIIRSDGRASTFWITNPDVTMEGNVAGGSERFGIWYVFPRRPIGPSAEVSTMEQNQALRTPLGPFVDNVAHSNNDYGLLFDGVLVANGDVHGGFNYRPSQDPTDPTSEPVHIQLNGYRGFKNYKSAKLRMPWVTATNFKIAESVEGIKFLFSAMGSRKLVNSIIVGETANKGEPEGWITLQNGTRVYWDRQIRMGGSDKFLPIVGVLLYEAMLELDGVTFDRFASNAVRPAAGIGVRRRNREYSSPVNGAKNLQFLFSGEEGGNRFYDANEGRGFEDRVGNIQTVLRDNDGSLTTYAGSTLVKPYDIHLNAKCADIPSWNMHVCPTMFTKIQFLWYDGSVNPLKTFLTRTDGSAEYGAENYQVSYALNAQENYILNFNTTVPRYMKLRLSGIEAGVTQILGVCIGRDVTPKELETTAVPVPSFDQLANEGTEVRYFIDKTVGVIFFRFSTPYERTPDTLDECAGQDGVEQGCPMVFIELHEKNTDGDCSQRAFPTYSTTPADATGGLTTPEV